jgi:DNA-binding transcriptional LysR family regulator
MELYQLRSFAAIAETGQLTRAAAQLHVSQPALSAQLKALEEELGVTLFKRTANGMMPTAHGKRLLGYAEKVLNAAQALRNEARALKGELAGKASIGTLSDPQLTRVGEFMSAVMARYPLLSLELHQAVTGVSLERVRDGSWDAGFYYGDLKYPTVAGLALGTLRFRVAAPIAWKDRIEHASWQDIAALPWVIPPPVSSHHQLAHALLSRHGVSPQKVVEADQEAVIASLVDSGVGLALMREEIAHEKAAAGEICLWSDAFIDTTLWFVYARERDSDPVMRALLDELRELWDLRKEPTGARRPSPHNSSSPA